MNDWNQIMELAFFAYIQNVEKYFSTKGFILGKQFDLILFLKKRKKKLDKLVLNFIVYY